MSDSETLREPVAILLLEDSEIDAELLTAHLERADFAFTIQRVVNRRDFIAAIEATPLDIILADFSLPDFDGLSALNIARVVRPDVPFVFVSGVVGEEFATNALKRGATDYVMKRNLGRLATAVERALEQARDRAEKRRAEQALQRSEARAKLAIEGAEMGLWDLDLHSGLLELDDRCRVLIGAPAAYDLTRQAFLEFCHPEDRQRLAAAMEHASGPEPEVKGALSEAFRIVHPDGRQRWVSLRAQAQCDATGCTHLLGVVRDVTEERRAQDAQRQLTEELEQQVAERNAELDRIWRFSTDLFVVADSEGRLRRVNPAWRDVLGYDPDTVVGSKIDILVHPEDRERSAQMLRHLMAGEIVERFEERIRHADGDWRVVSWTAVPDGPTIYAFGRDITEERSATAALAQRNQDLAEQIAERERVEATLRQMQRLEAVGQLTSGVAHDFNNLLTVILGNIEMVGRTAAKDQNGRRIVERLGHMRIAAERGAKLTAQMLAFSRRQKLEPKPVDLNDTVRGMHDLLQSTMGGSIRIETVLRKRLWMALVDPTQIELVILNLAINARDAMEVGGALTVETMNAVVGDAPTRPEHPSPGEYVVLAVSDTGPGMTPEALERAFEPFFTTKEVGKGSGLGLAQVFGFAKQSGGGVRIDNWPGEGVSVQVYLPKADVAVVSEEPRPASIAAAAHACQTILVLDDDSAVREITATMLDGLGYEVCEAGSGVAALDILRGAQTIDLMLADYAMPGMNGVEVARAAAEIRPDLPVLFITGYADLTALRDVGESRIIRKPFRDEELAAKVANALGPAQNDNVVPLRR